MEWKTLVRGACVAATFSVLAACGGGSAGSTAGAGGQSGGGGGTPSQTIQGIATPSSVSVVTATNAGG